jgi:hypothetical protein
MTLNEQYYNIYGINKKAHVISLGPASGNFFCMKYLFDLINIEYTKQK